MSRISGDELRRAGVFGRGLQEVAARPRAEVLRLADVNHPAGGVFHQIDAGRLREGANLLGGQRVVGGWRRFGHLVSAV